MLRNLEGPRYCFATRRKRCSTRSISTIMLLQFRDGQ
jgi:hypothetical protein